MLCQDAGWLFTRRDGMLLSLHFFKNVLFFFFNVIFLALIFTVSAEVSQKEESVVVTSLVLPCGLYIQKIPWAILGSEPETPHGYTLCFNGYRTYFLRPSRFFWKHLWNIPSKNVTVFTNAIDSTRPLHFLVVCVNSPVLAQHYHPL